MGRRGGAPFAHILGTLEGGIERIPGTEGAPDHSWGEPNVYDSPSKGNVSINFKTDAATAELRSFLLHTLRSCRTLYSTLRHLGLPETSVQTKMPYYRYVPQTLLRPRLALLTEVLTDVYLVETFCPQQEPTLGCAQEAAPDMPV